MYPHIGNILRGNIVTEPFVPAFVNDDEVPFQPPATAGQGDLPVGGGELGLEWDPRGHSGDSHSSYSGLCRIPGLP